MSLYLCLDCGGSKTVAAVCDSEGKLIGQAFGGPSNLNYSGVEAFLTAVRQSVESACGTSLPPKEPLFASVWIGVSGIDSPEAIAQLTPGAEALLGVSGDQLKLSNDVQLLAAPLALYSDARYAMCVISGTGSVVVAVDHALNELHRVGGWGWLLGDEGSGFHVGRTAVRALLSKPPNEASTLADALLTHFGATHAMGIFPAIYAPNAAPQMRLSVLPPLVFKHAFGERPDPLALRVVKQCASDLAAQVIETLHATSVEPTKSVLCFGGSLVGVESYRKLVIDALNEASFHFAGAEFVQDVAVIGAKGLAARHGVIGSKN